MAPFLSPRRTLLLAVIAAASGAPLPAVAQPATIHVWPGLFPCDTTLQACADGAFSGDQIRIATNGPIQETVAFSKGLTLRAASGYQPVFVNGGITANTGSSGTRTIRVDGLRFEQSVVYLNQASTGAATFLVTNNTFQGGAIALGTNVPGAGPVSFTVTGNTMESLFNPGISVSSLTAAFTGVIADNVIEMEAGSAYGIALGPRVTADVLRNRISGDARGIGVTGDADVRIVNNLVVGPPDPPGVGQDGIDVLGIGVISATIANNTIAHWDKGLDIDDDAGLGGSVYAQIANNLITDNRIGIDNEADVDDAANFLDYPNNLFFANAVSNVLYTLGVSISIQVADPLYVSEADFHLRPGSPAIDAGRDDSVPEDIVTDLDGTPRIQGEAVDIGAYEAPEPGRVAGALAAIVALGALRRLHRW